MAAIKPINANLDLTTADFDFVKASLIAFLQGQEQFKGYDFKGANMNVLLDLLAHNTQKNIFFLNMNFAESWLDSAQLRESVSSHAKSLNYLPRSSRSSKASVRLTFKASGTNQPYIIQKGSPFTSLIKNQSYMFTIPETITIGSPNQNYSVDCDIFEGIYLKDTFIATEDISQRFRISNRAVDTSSINVMVFEDNSVVGTTYRFVQSLLDLDENSKVFFLQPAENGFYEFLFGDNNIGYRPKSGSVVVADYRVSSGSESNGAARFTAAFDPTAPHSELLSTVKVETLVNAADGDEPESLDSIKYYAPRHFQVQERFVIPSDYEVGLKTQFPEINAVSVIGGEDMNPAQFGSVYIALNLKNIDSLPDTKIQQYYDFVRRRSSMIPVFIPAEYSYLRIQSIVKYNINVTTNSPNNIKTLLMAGISDYNDNELSDFGVDFLYSPFSDMIDGLDKSIISNLTTVSVYKKINPTAETADYVLDYGMPIINDLTEKDKRFSRTERTALESSVFRYNGQTAILKDNSAGAVWIVASDDNLYSKIIEIGSIDYAKGLVTLNSFKADDYDGEAIKVYVMPASEDITIPKNTFAEIEVDAIELDVRQVRV